jgi:hypothetical protein
MLFRLSIYNDNKNEFIDLFLKVFDTQTEQFISFWSDTPCHIDLLNIKDQIQKIINKDKLYKMFNLGIGVLYHFSEIKKIYEDILYLSSIEQEEMFVLK